MVFGISRNFEVSVFLYLLLFPNTFCNLILKFGLIYSLPVSCPDTGGLQLLGEQQPLVSDRVGTVPLSTESRAAMSLVERECDNVIGSMVAAVASGGDEEAEEEGEKGEVAEKEKGVCSKHICHMYIVLYLCMH